MNSPAALGHFRGVASPRLGFLVSFGFEAAVLARQSRRLVPVGYVVIAVAAAVQGSRRKGSRRARFRSRRDSCRRNFGSARNPRVSFPRERYDGRVGATAPSVRRA